MTGKRWAVLALILAVSLVGFYAGVGIGLQLDATWDMAVMVAPVAMTSMSPITRIQLPGAPRHRESQRTAAGRRACPGLRPTTIDYLENGLTYQVRGTVFDTYGDATTGAKSATPRAS